MVRGGNISLSEGTRQVEHRAGKSEGEFSRYEHHPPDLINHEHTLLIHSTRRTIIKLTAEKA